METITLLIKEVISTGFQFLTTIKFEVEREQALLAISDLPPTDLCPTWEKEIMAYDGDILQAYLRIYAALLNDSWAANDLKSADAIDELIKKMDMVYSDILLSLDGSDGIKLIEFKKSRTPIRSFKYIVGESYIWDLAVKHPEGITAIYRIDAIHLEQIKQNIEKKGSTVFYFGSLRDHLKGSILYAYLVIITKMIAESFPELSVPAIIERFHTFDRLSQNLDGSDGIELISFTTKKLYSSPNGPGTFKFIIEEL